MSMYSRHGMGAVPPGNSARLNELLDQIRAEFETQLRQTEGFEHQSTYNRNPPHYFPQIVLTRTWSNSIRSSQRDAASPRKGLHHGADSHDAQAKVCYDPASVRLAPCQYGHMLTTVRAADTKKRSTCSDISLKPPVRVVLNLACLVLPSMVVPRNSRRR